MNRQNKAFTLVELLVVIGIIAVLISILLPVICMARQLAVNLCCKSNLRQVGQAAFIYAGNSKGFFPQACFEDPIPVGAPPRTIYTSDSPYRFSKEQAAVMSRLMKGNTSIWYCKRVNWNPPAGQRPITPADFYPPDHNRPWIDSPIQSGRILYWWVANPNPPDYLGPLTDVTGSGDFFASATPASMAAPQYAAPAYRDVNKNGSIRDEYMRRMGEKNASQIVICTDQTGNINQPGWYFDHGKFAVMSTNAPMSERRKLTRSWKNNLYGDGHVEQKRPDEVEWRFGPTNGMCW